LDAIDELFEKKEISEEAYEAANKKIAKYKKEIVKHRYNSTIEFFINYYRKTYREVKRFLRFQLIKREEVVKINKETMKISIAGSQRALAKLHELDKAEHGDIADNLIYVFQRHYEDRLELLQGRHGRRSPEFNKSRINLEIKALGYQRAFVQDLLERGKISRLTANELRQNINYSEEVINIDIE
jgi:hypothetical protein